MSAGPGPVRRFRRAGFFLAGGLLLLLATIAVVARGMDQDRLLFLATSRLSAALDRPVAASELRISLPEGAFVVRGLQVGREPLDAGPAPPVLSIAEVRGDLGLWSLLRARLHFESLAIRPAPDPSRRTANWSLQESSTPVCCAAASPGTILPPPAMN